MTKVNIEKESEQFLLNWLDTIPKTRRSKKSKEKDAKLDVKKETVAFMRNVDYVRLRGFNIRNLQYELTSTSFFLTKDSF